MYRRNHLIFEIIPYPHHQFRMNRYGYRILDGSEPQKNRSQNLSRKKIVSYLILRFHFSPCFSCINIPK